MESDKLQAAQKPHSAHNKMGLLESKALQLLHNYWGYERFKPLQWEVIASVLEQRDTVALLPTGGGKSICFQVPALMRAGCCLVVSPLVSLMKDQTAQLQARGIKSASLYGNRSRRALHRLFDQLEYEGCNLLYISPERLRNQEVIERLKGIEPKLIAIDEAHCISQWGHDFRPAYLRLRDIKMRFPQVPVLALSATATPRVVEDITKNLGLAQPRILQRSFKRENLRFHVVHAAAKEQAIHSILREAKGSAIVYTRSRKGAEQLSQYLNERGLQSCFYHAGLTMAAKDQRQRQWTEGQIQTLVATTAFGMGIDKAAVRCIIHRDLPESIEALYQEAGRAGRDGKEAHSWLIKNKADETVVESRLAYQNLSIALVLQLYIKLNNHFQIALGERSEAVHTIDIAAFSKKYKHPTHLVQKAVKVLENYGVLRFIELTNRRSSVRLDTDANQLQALYRRGSMHEKLIDSLLRLYSGIFSEACPVDEHQIARHSGLDLLGVKRVLWNLHRHGVLYYTPKELQRIQFLVPREDAQTINAFKKTFLTVQQHKAERMDLVRRYAFESKRCRSRFILDYFGEETSENCGKCDICLDTEKRRQA